MSKIFIGIHTGLLSMCEKKNHYGFQG